MDKSYKQKNNYGIVSVERALSILKLFSDQNNSLSLMEICGLTGLNKSTALRMVYTLREEGFLEIEELTKKYKLGSSAVKIGLSALESLSLPKVADPVLRDLVDKTGLIAHLGILEGVNVVVISKIFPLNKSLSYMRLASRIGGIMPTYCTGIGQLFLSQESDEFIKEFLEKCEIIKYTSTTETDVNLIIERIHKAKKDGYLINNGEHDEGIISICYPVYDYTRRIIAGISLGGVRDVFYRLDFEPLRKATEHAAKLISEGLGYYD